MCRHEDIDPQLLHHIGVEMEYCEMLFQLETEHSDKELYWIIA